MAAKEGAFVFASEWDDDSGWRSAMEKELGPLDWRRLDDVGAREQVEVALAWDPPSGFLATLPNLRLIVSLGMGVDHLLKHRDLPRDVPIVRIHDASLIDQMSEYCQLASLRILRLSDEYDALQRNAQWKRLRLPEARDVRIGVMGLGAIGARVAADHLRLGFPVAGWARRKKSIEGVECFAGADALAPFLARTDVLICLLPLTQETRGILDASCFALLPKGAHIINVARGGHVVDDDLLAALDSGYIASATLDVFNQEPLPAGHPYWRHPRVRVTPHIAGQSNPRTAAPGVADNIRRRREGQTLHDLIDPAAGY
ncbi:MAG: 2-hydroxyacid dehydrogenase [Reyranellaceae bacterium]